MKALQCPASEDILKTIAVTLVATLLAVHCSPEAKSPEPVRKAEPSVAPKVEMLTVPTGTGAAEPFLSATPQGILLSWLEPVSGTDRVALRYARFASDKWSAPATVVERNDLFVNWADFPSIVADANGVLYAHWLQKSGQGTYAYDVRMAISRDGNSWGEPFLLNRDGKQSEHGFVTLAALPAGGVGATWLDGRNMTGDGEHGDHDPGNMSLRYAEVDPNGTFKTDVQLDDRTCECCTTGMTMTSAGPVIVYRDRSPEEIRDIAVIRRNGNDWTKPQPLQSDGWKIAGCPVNGPQIDSIGERAAVAWFTAANGKSRVLVAFSDDSAATFGAPVQADEGNPIGRVDLVLLDADTALVTWLEQKNDGGEIRARKVHRTRGAQPSVKIADSSSTRAAGFTRMARSGADVWFAWTETAGDSKRVQVARMKW